MTATTRFAECSVAVPTLYLAFDLGSTAWVLAFATAPAQRPRVRRIVAGDLTALTQECLTAKAHFGLSLEAPVRSCYEAGRDGFWLHRWLTAHDMTNVVVDAASIEVNRRARRAKTDRLDASKLVVLLMRAAAGERHVWSVVRVPTPAAEASRQLTREMATVREDRKRVRNRMHSLLATQGIRVALRARFLHWLETATTGDGRALLPAWRERLAREWAHLEAIEARLATLREVCAASLAAGTDRVSHQAKRLCRLRGIGELGATVLSAELFGTRQFQNARQLGAITGLVPVPYRSDQHRQDQGISKAGRAELRRLAIQLAWGWLRWQPHSALTQWFHRRFGPGGGRSRRIGIVAVARKLVIALWRYLEQDLLPAGATHTTG